MNVPKTNVPLHGIIGADILPSVYKPGRSFTNPMVGNSVFGAFLSGIISGDDGISFEPRPHSVNCLISSKDKSFQLALELLINNYFEFDNTKEHERNMSSNQINTEKIFLQDIDITTITIMIVPCSTR